MSHKYVMEKNAETKSEAELGSFRLAVVARGQIDRQTDLRIHTHLAKMQITGGKEKEETNLTFRAMYADANVSVLFVLSPKDGSLTR